MDARDETRRLLARLKAWIAFSGETQQRIERRAGLSRGYLSQLLSGHVDVKYRQLLAVLAAMGLDPADFFGEVFPRPPSRGQRRAEPPLGLDVRRLFGFGLAAVEDLRQRLARCEAAIEELRARGYFD